MKNTIKRFVKSCVDHSKKYRGWDSQAIAKDSYLAGYRQCLTDNNLVEETSPGAVLIDYESEDGDHQLSVKNTRGYVCVDCKKENSDTNFTMD